MYLSGVPFRDHLFTAVLWVFLGVERSCVCGDGR